MLLFDNIIIPLHRDFISGEINGKVNCHRRHPASHKNYYRLNDPKISSSIQPAWNFASV